MQEDGTKGTKRPRDIPDDPTPETKKQKVSDQNQSLQKSRHEPPNTTDSASTTPSHVKPLHPLSQHRYFCPWQEPFAFQKKPMVQESNVSLHQSNPYDLGTPPLAEEALNRLRDLLHR